MTINRIRPTGWSANEKFTSPQATQLDINIASALDKSVRGDDLLGVVTVRAGAGFTCQSSSLITCDAGSTQAFNGACALGATGTFHYTNGSQSTHDNGSIETHATGSTDTYASGSHLTTSSGALVSLGGTVVMPGTVEIDATLTLGADPAITLLSPLTQTRVSQFAFSANPGSPAWSIAYNAITGTLAWVDSTNSGAMLIIPLDLPDGQTLIDARVHFIGAPGDVALPATMPKIAVVYSPFGVVPGAIGTATVLGSVTTDASPNVGVYTADHLIDVSGLSHVIDSVNNYYFIALNGEAGANSNTGARFLGARATITRSTIKE